LNIELYTRKTCSLCEVTKQFLKSHLISYTEYVIDETIARDDVVKRFPDAKMLPIAVVDGTWIGGKNELAKIVLANGASHESPDQNQNPQAS
jgi:glutaredoxin